MPVFIYYLIEGTPFKKPDSIVQGIPFKNLMAHLDHCQLQNIRVIYCQNLSDVLPRLYTLMDNFATSEKYIRATEGGAYDVKEQLKEKITKTDDEKILDYWCAIKGVSYKTAAALKNAEISLIEVWKGEVDEKTIAAAKFDSGRSIGTKKAQVIIRNIKVSAEKILSAISGVSAATAKFLVADVGFEKIIDLEDMSELKLNGRRIGKLSEKISYAIKLMS